MDVKTALIAFFATFGAVFAVLLALRLTRVRLKLKPSVAALPPDAAGAGRPSKFDRGKPRTSKCLAIVRDSVRHTDSAYVRGYVGELGTTLLADDEVIAERHRRLSSMLASRKPVKTMIQFRYSVHTDRGGVIAAHRASQPPPEDVYAPAAILHEQGVRFYEEQVEGGAFKSVQLSVWARVPTKHTNDNVNSGLGAFWRRFKSEWATVGLRGLLPALLGSYRASNDGILRRMRADEEEALAGAERVFRQIERESSTLKLRHLQGDALRAALYLGHNESATSVPQIGAAPMTDLRGYLTNDRIVGDDSWYVIHGHTPVAMLTLFTPPEPGAHAAILRGVINNPSITCRHTVIVEYITLDKEKSRAKLGSRMKRIRRASMKVSGVVKMSEEAERSYNEIRSVKEELTSPSETMVQMRFRVLVYGEPARTEEEKRASVKRLDEDCERILMAVRSMPGADAAREEPEAIRALYDSAIVGELDPKPTQREVEEVAKSLATLIPCETGSTGSKNGHTLAQNMTGELFLLDLFRPEKFSPLGIVLGGMGAGKTVLLARIGNDVLATKPHASVIGVDFNEGLATWVAVNGGRHLKFVQAEGEAPRTLNIWYYEGLEEGTPPDDEQIALVVGDIARLAKVPGDDVIGETIIETVVREVYQREVPYNGSGYDLHEPTHSHFLNTLKAYQWREEILRARAAVLLTILEKYRGNQWLDAPTHPDFLMRSRCDIYEIDSLDKFPPAIRASLAYRVGARLISSVGKKVDGQLMPLLILFPETHKHKEKYPQILDALKKGARMGRTNNVVTLLDTHAYEDLDGLHDITANAGIRIIGKQNKSYDAVVREAGLSEAAAAAIGAIHNVAGSHAQYVVALGSGPDKKVEMIQLALSPAELWTFTTHPMERNVRARVQQLKPNWTAADVVIWLAANYPRGIVFEGLSWINESLIPTDADEAIQQGHNNAYVDSLLTRSRKARGRNARYFDKFGELPRRGRLPSPSSAGRDARGLDSQAVN